MAGILFLRLTSSRWKNEITDDCDFLVYSYGIKYSISHTVTRNFKVTYVAHNISIG